MHKCYMQVTCLTRRSAANNCTCSLPFGEEEEESQGILWMKQQHTNEAGARVHTGQCTSANVQDKPHETLGKHFFLLSKSISSISFKVC